MNCVIILVTTLLSFFLITLSNSSTAQQNQPESQWTNTSVMTGTVIDAITFESIPGAGLPQEGMQISTQFRESSGITFMLEGGGVPVIAQVGEPATAFRGRPSNDGADNPAPGQNIGSFFLTDDGLLGVSATPLIVQYSPPTAAASGVILDIDARETFMIEARDENDLVLQQIMFAEGDPETGDGIATRWSFSRDNADIFSIRFVGSKTSGAFGLEFDNFSARSAQPAPSPLPVTSGLVLHLLADDVVTTDNGTVDIWPDHSGSDIVAEQSIMAQQPTVVEDALNGHKTVRFDGIDDRLALSHNVFSSVSFPKTVFAVIQSTDVNGHIIGYFSLAIPKTRLEFA